MVASGGFGPMVQPGQAVVQYTIAPDADGDGIGELVVVNSASVAPNGDVISDPISNIQMGDTVKLISAQSTRTQTILRNLQAQQASPISVTPGTILEFEVDGLNSYSIGGTVAFFYLPDDNTYTVTKVRVLPHPSDNNLQAAYVMIPALAEGNVKLALINLGREQVGDIIDLKVNALPALTIPIEEASSEYFAHAREAIQNDNFTNEQKTTLLQRLSVAEGAMEDLIKELKADSSSESAQALDILERNARLALNIPDDFSPQIILLGHCNDAAVGTGLALIGLIPGWGLAAAGTSLAFNAYNTFKGKKRDDVGTVIDTATLSVGVIEVLRKGSDLRNSAEGVGQRLSVLSVAWNASNLVSAASQGDCFHRGPTPTNSPGRTTGMGSAPPPGGTGAGDILPSNALSNYEAGQHSVKVFVGNSSVPFSGLSDATGYFYVPLIPQDQPFKAVATDTLTGETRIFEGIGPKIGESVYMFFDFSSDNQESVPKLALDSNTTATVPESFDLYKFEGKAGDHINIAFLGENLSDSITVRVTDPNGAVVDRFKPFTFEETGVFTIVDSGNYFIEISNPDGAAGSYTLGLAKIEEPSPITLTQPRLDLSGRINVLGDHQYFSFNSVNNDIIAVFQDRTESMINHRVRLRRPGLERFYNRDGISFNISNNGKSRPLILPDNGEYILEIANDFSGRNTFAERVGNWSIKVFNPESVEPEFDSNNDGVLEKGGFNEYLFKGTAGQSISIAIYPENVSGFLRGEIYDSRFNRIRRFSSTGGTGIFTLTETDTYTVIVDGAEVSEGSYIFGFSDIDDATPIPLTSLPATVSASIEGDRRPSAL